MRILIVMAPHHINEYAQNGAEICAGLLIALRVVLQLLTVQKPHGVDRALQTRWPRICSSSLNFPNPIQSGQQAKTTNGQVVVILV